MLLHKRELGRESCGVLELVFALAAGALQLSQLGFAFLKDLFAPSVVGLAGEVVPEFVGVEFAGAVLVFLLAMEAGLLEIGGHGLQGVKSEASGFVVDGAVEDAVNHVGEGVMDSVGVFHETEVEGGFFVGPGGAAQREVDVGLAVVMAEVAVAQSGRAALNSVGLDVAAATSVVGHNHLKI